MKLTKRTVSSEKSFSGKTVLRNESNSMFLKNNNKKEIERLPERKRFQASVRSSNSSFVNKNGYSDDSDDDTGICDCTTLDDHKVANTNASPIYNQSCQNSSHKDSNGSSGLNEYRGSTSCCVVNNVSVSLQHKNIEQTISEKPSIKQNGNNYLRFRNLKRRKLHLHSDTVEPIFSNQYNCKTSDNNTQCFSNHCTESKCENNREKQQRSDEKNQHDNLLTNNHYTSVPTYNRHTWSLQYCSVLLPIVTVVFFIILGLLYVAMKADSIDDGSNIKLSFYLQVRSLYDCQDYFKQWAFLHTLKLIKCR